MSTEGSAAVPNDWTVRGGLALEEQGWTFTAPCSRHAEKRDWVSGFGLWSWNWCLPECARAQQEKGYELYEKPAEKVVRNFYETRK